MPLTSRFQELIEQLDVSEAAWHLSRTNAWTETHASQKEIDDGHNTILRLIRNENNCVKLILDWVEEGLRSISSMDVLLVQRQEATLKQWWQPIRNDSWRNHYNSVIQKITRRLLLEKTKRNAEIILNWGFRVIQWWEQEKGKIPLTVVKDESKARKAA